MNSPEKRNSPVRRITIDERLADDLVRILVADLKANREKFGDEPKHWRGEKELLVRPDDYQEKMGMTQANVKKWPWESLYEGQVFLQGEFRGNPKKDAKKPFVVYEKRRSFQCIDRLSKERVKKSYLAALEGGSRNGQTNQT
ncbi:hypothetical protein ES703_112732 [subsurface metagenome]